MQANHDPGDVLHLVQECLPFVSLLLASVKSLFTSLLAGKVWL